MCLSCWLSGYLRLCVWHEDDTVVAKSLADVGQSYPSVTCCTFHHRPSCPQLTCESHMYTILKIFAAQQQSTEPC